MTRKQTGDNISSLAAKWFNRLEGLQWYTLMSPKEVNEIRSICASALAQDEVKGRRKRRAA